MRKTLLALSALLAGAAAQAQLPALINSGLVLQQGSQLHEEGKYKDAIRLYRTIPRNDTNYLRTLYELAMSYEQDSSFQQGLDAIREAEELGTGAMEAQFMLMKASLADDMSQSDRALRLYDSVLAKYPNSDEAMLNRAITLIRLNRHPEAATQLKTLLIGNPYYSSAHMKLATCALKEGRIVPAMMALFTYLVINPEGRHHQAAISLLDQIANNREELQKMIQDRKEEEVFAREERVLLSKMAFESSYKLQTKLDDKIVRQLQALFDIVKYDESSDDFYMQFYVPFLRALADNKHFEPIVNHAFSSVQVDLIQKYMKHNTREVKNAIAEAVNYFNGIRSTRELQASRRAAAPAQYITANNSLAARGRVNDKQDPTGTWEYFYARGNVKAIGNYDEKGERHGYWKYFYGNGVVSGTDNWIHGVQTGADTVYFMDGSLSSTATYSSTGKLDGAKTQYFSNGRRKSVTSYKDGKEDGPFQVFYASGRTRVEGSMKDDKQTGTFKRYLKNGKLEIECHYENGELEGLYKSYHDNGQLAYEASYKAGKIEGIAKNYHANGKLKDQRSFVDGLMEGDLKEYDAAGVLRSNSPFVKGKLQGTAHFYDWDGKESSTSVYDKGVMNEVRYLDKRGQEIAAFKRKGRSFPFTAYTPDGSKNADQTYNDKGERDGLLTLFYPDGKVHQTIPYKNGSIEGTVTSFYPDGTKEFEIAYKDGDKDGLDKTWHPNGKLQQVGYYKEGDQDGDWSTFNLDGTPDEHYTYRDNDLTGYSESYLANGRLDNETVYDGGWLRAINQYDSTGKRIFHTELNNKSSRYTSIYPNGQKRYDGQYEYGDYQGKMTHYYFNGKVQREKTYDRGLLQGPYIEYFFNGKTQLTGQYELGDRVGPWKHYSEDGHLNEEENYVNGELDGKDKIYFANGKPKWVFEYRSGEKHGICERYAPDGSLIMALQFVEGELKAYSYMGKDGKLVPFIPLPDGTGHLVAYYANGTKSAEMDYLDSRFNGDYILYHDNGKVYYKSKEVYGQTNGVAYEYYRDGKVYSEYKYDHDQLTGAYKLYHENGKVKEEGEYVNGVANGWESQYDASGKRISYLFYYYGLLMDAK
ncbi:tetratricopeptide repeat protein [Flaviaesturariibacter terrae]